MLKSNAERRTERQTNPPTLSEAEGLRATHARYTRANAAHTTRVGGWGRVASQPLYIDRLKKFFLKKSGPAELYPPCHPVTLQPCKYTRPVTQPPFNPVSIPALSPSSPITRNSRAGIKRYNRRRAAGILTERYSSYCPVNFLIAGNCRILTVRRRVTGAKGAEPPVVMVVRVGEGFFS